VKITFEFADAFAWDRVGDNHGRFFKDSLGLIDRVNNLSEVMSADVLYIPVPCFSFVAERVEWHDVVRKAVNLDVVPIQNCDQVS
jgi:hypothetical protein